MGRQGRGKDRRNIVKVLLKNTVIQWIGAALSKIIGMALILVITRSLGSGQFGKYTLVFTFLAFFTLLSSFGIQTIAIREVSKNPDDASAILGDVMFFSGMFSLLSALLCIGTSYLFGYEADILMGIKVAVVGIFLSTFAAHQVIFNARLKMGYVVAGNLLRDVTLLVLALYLSHIKAGFIAYVWSSVGASVIAAVYTLVVGCRLTVPKFVFNMARYKKIFLASLPLGLSGVALYIYNYVDTIMLSKMSTMNIVGYYGVAYKFVFLCQIIPQAILVTLFPIFSQLNQTDRSKAQRYFQYTFDTIFLVAVFLALCGILFSRDVILLLFSKEYLPSAVPLTIFCVNFLIMFPNMLFSRYLISLGRQTDIFMFMTIAAVLNVGVNFWAIPRYGIVGAALTTMLSEIVFCALSVRLLYREDDLTVAVTSGIKMILTAFVLIVIGNLVQFQWIMEVFLLLLLYLVGTYVSRAFDYPALKLLLQKD
jgi:O-antigen/teichoic acid export membrane protein